MASKLLLAVALLGMVALAAAVDAEVQKKHYKKEHEEEEYKPEHHKAPVWKHVEFELKEKMTSVWPCDSEHYTLGAAVTYDADLLLNDKVVGAHHSTGIVAGRNKCPDQCPYVTKSSQINTYVFTHEGYEGELVAGGVYNSGKPASVTWSVLGGSGAFEGASGTVLWTRAPEGSAFFGSMKFDVWVPKFKHAGEEEEEEEEKY